MWIPCLFCFDVGFIPAYIKERLASRFVPLLALRWHITESQPCHSQWYSPLFCVDRFQVGTRWAGTEKNRFLARSHQEVSGWCNMSKSFWNFIHFVKRYHLRMTTQIINIIKRLWAEFSLSVVFRPVCKSSSCPRLFIRTHFAFTPPPTLSFFKPFISLSLSHLSLCPSLSFFSSCAPIHPRPNPPLHKVSLIIWLAYLE